MEPYSKILAKVISYISYRPRSELEIRIYCTKVASSLRADSATIDQVMRRVSELGYIDDLRFTQLFFHDRMHVHRKGERVIRMQLRAKGIADSTIDAVAADQAACSPEERVDRILRALGRRIDVWCRLPANVCRQKVFLYLIRHGYTQDDIHIFIDSYLKNRYNTTVEKQIIN